MRRGGSTNGRISPTNTTYSSISNYKTDSYARQNQSDAKPQDTREIARVHYRELSVYLASYLANGAHLYIILWVEDGGLM